MVNVHEIGLPVTAADRKGHDGSVTLGIRPERFRVSDDGQGIPVIVSVVEELGADAYLYGVADTGAESAKEGALTGGTDVVIRVEARRDFERGSTVHVTSDPEYVHVFATESGERLDAA